MKMKTSTSKLGVATKAMLRGKLTTLIATLEIKQIKIQNVAIVLDSKTHSY